MGVLWNKWLIVSRLRFMAAKEVFRGNRARSCPLYVGELSHFAVNPTRAYVFLYWSSLPNMLHVQYTAPRPEVEMFTGENMLYLIPPAGELRWSNPTPRAATPVTAKANM